ncbi:cysteine--tRNA ligase 2, cytoplasmic-like [Glycine soja]|uniref:cysteine--tRNA ligase 2, cytoplasmic-like n=1 Tax=Glycine soja TaxID=3848 RepID=UPI00103C2828|nr:cysteine--tRNA ligase 2, cytoplasmic-like [Glycine soja]
MLFLLLLLPLLGTPQQKPASLGIESSFVQVTGNTSMDSAEKRLNELGYKQELRREMTLQDCKDVVSPLLQGETKKNEKVPQINETAKECIKKLNVEFQTKMSNDLQTPVILTGALQEALKFVNASLKMLKVLQ